MGSIIYKIKNLLKCNQRYNHYFLHNTTNDPITKNIKINKITTWNIQELFCYCYKGNKINNIINKINSFESDIICLQEVFESSSITKIIKNNDVKNTYPYYLSGSLANRFIFGETSGLLVLSKYPIIFHKFSQFKQSTIPDIFASKGALYFSIGDYNFITTHLQSECPRIAKNQLHDILNISPFNKKTILLGDLNFDTPCYEIGVPDKYTTITHPSSFRILDHIISVHTDIHLNVHAQSIDLYNCTDHFPVHAIIKN